MPIVSYTVANSIATLTISRPERRNAMNHEGVEELKQGVHKAVADNTRVLIVRGSHGHFCAGADLKELEDLEFTRNLRKMLDALADTPFPTIAAISGSCMGLGAQIALACDLRIASADARFAVPVAKLGLMVDHWTLQRLALLAGQSAARWMTLTARPVPAERAHQVGFVHEIADDPDIQAGELAEGITRLAPLSLAGTKLGLNQLERNNRDLDPRQTYQTAFERAWASDDLEEGQKAFNEGRAPEFQGR